MALQQLQESFHDIILHIKKSNKYKFYQEEFERSRALPDSITGLETSHMNEKKERSELAKATSKLNSESTNPWQKAQQEKKKGIGTP